MLYKATLTMLCLFFLASCKKSDSPKTDKSVNELAQLKPGNYWIYENYTVDENGNGQRGDLNGQVYYDSVFVEKDTTIANHAYHKVMKHAAFGDPAYMPEFLRDSLNYLVDNKGFVVLAPDDYMTVFRTYVYPDPGLITTDSAVVARFRMADRDKQVSVPAGSWPTCSMDVIWSHYPFAATGRPVTVRKQHRRYARGIGLVTETLPFYTNVPTYDERRLVRYHLN